MTTVGKFLRFDAVINVLTIACAALVILKSHAAKEVGSGIIGDGSIEVGTMLTLGLWAVLFLPAIVIAFSSSSVVSKKNLHAGAPAKNAGYDNGNRDSQIDP